MEPTKREKKIKIRAIGWEHFLVIIIFVPTSRFALFIEITHTRGIPENMKLNNNWNSLNKLKDTNISYLQVVFLDKCTPTSTNLGRAVLIKVQYSRP